MSSKDFDDTVNAFLILNGFSSAHSQGGWFLGGKAELTLDPTLDLVQTWTQPISPPRPGVARRRTPSTSSLIRPVSTPMTKRHTTSYSGDIFAPGRRRLPRRETGVTVGGVLVCPAGHPVSDSRAAVATITDWAAATSWPHVIESLLPKGRCPCRPDTYLDADTTIL